MTNDREHGTVEDLPSLPHYLPPGLAIAFVGYNPGLESARAGHYYAHHGNVFWRQLSESGLVGRSVSHLDDMTLQEEAGIGFVDLCCRPTARASELRPEEMREGAARLKRELEAASPRFAVFSGRGIYQAFGHLALGLSRRELSGRSDGMQPERIGMAAPFVIPSSSGLASRWHGERLALLHELRELVSQPGLPPIKEPASD